MPHMPLHWASSETIPDPSSEINHRTLLSEFVNVEERRGTDSRREMLA